jgi:uncharacterized protein (TIGR02246 family)
MADKETLEGMVASFRNAIVGKDATALGALFAEDADFVNIAAMHWSGREAIAGGHAKMFAGPLQITLDITSVNVRFIRDDVAIIVSAWSRDVPANATGPTLPPGTGVLVFVATRGDAGWLFASAQNTQAMALPGGPPGGPPKS